MMRTRGKGKRRLVSLLEITGGASNVELILRSHVLDLLLFLSYFHLYRVLSLSPFVCPSVLCDFHQSSPIEPA